MSRSSMTKLIILAQSTPVEFKSMITLTYPSVFPADGNIVKADLNYMLTRMRKQVKGFSYLWFLEFQERGAPHLHVLTSVGEVCPRMRASLLIGWVSRVFKSEWFIANCPIGDHSKVIGDMLKFNAHQKVWELIRSEEGGRRYVTKYAAKSIQKAVPKEYQNVGRFWGASKDCEPIVQATIDVTDEDVRNYLKEHDHPAADWDIVPKYIYGLAKSPGGAIDKTCAIPVS